MFQDVKKRDIQATWTDVDFLVGCGEKTATDKMMWENDGRGPDVGLILNDSTRVERSVARILGKQGQ